MTLSEDECRKFSRAIVTYVPEPLLKMVLLQLNVMTDLVLVEKQFAGPMDHRYGWLVEQAVEVHDRYDRALDLSKQLCRQMFWYPEFLGAIAAIGGLVQPDHRQAFLARRDNLFLAGDLEAKLEEYLPRICCIAGDFELAGTVSSKMGTGFLVGPDLILTARHVFEPLVDADRKRVAESFAVYFDHKCGEPITRHNVQRAGVRRVALARDWLVADHPSMPGDGTIAVPNPEQIMALKAHLDFALVRLAEKVGLEPIKPTGGRLRHWVKLPPCGPASVQFQARITIAQHPAGEAQSIDFGRVVRHCESGTRIMYDVETGQGTSGAPCFSREFALVGIHNATYLQIANQAIRFDAVCGMVRPHIDAPDQLPAATRIWNVAKPPAAPRVIFGRTRFLDWLARTLSDETRTKADRIYAAVGKSHGAGKTFSAEILETGIAGKRGFLALRFGLDRQVMPARLEDLIAVMASAFGLRAQALADEGMPMPSRPGISLPESATDGDKLHRWASVLVPRWFAQVLELHRTVATDRAADANRLVEQSKTLNAEQCKEVASLASAPVSEPVVREAWSQAWIVLDDLEKTDLTREIKEFLAAMVGAGQDDASMPPVLRRLRWLFLGYRPDYLAESDCVVENLEAGTLEEADINTLLDSLKAFRSTLKDEDIAEFRKTLLGHNLLANQLGMDPALRLRHLQGAAVLHLPKMTEYGDRP
ncbi:trypsin-like serine peptidase [Cupriavidus basilensis]|uniref:trypsin-like serine peptidase n=1 Tax=Cupriavidus basilensis TaxID=68895 RepID=UPI0023E80B03|nr:serine protease [Cupriavidus basilensis]MDF3886680.1 serine protease [Cupriavidus basilensis]